MSTARSFARSFSGGEVTPEFWGQIADAKFQTGLALCKNFKVLPHGPVENRAGTQFVRKAKNNGVPVRLIPFEFSDTQTMVLEFGDQYIRFHTMGATVESSPGVAYEVSTPYAQADLFDIHYVQSADVLTLVHPNYAPRELRRLGPTSWTLTTIMFAPTISAPSTPTATATTAASPSGLRTYAYVITATNADGEESLASGSASCSNNLLQTGAYNTLTWSAVTGAVRYSVYRQSNGLYGYIGTTDALTYKDDSADQNTPDISKTPANVDTTLAGGAGDYPGAVSYFEQRRVFAGTINKPQNLWMTRSATESNLNYSIPVRDADRVAIKVSSRKVNRVRHIVPLTNMVLLTSSAAWRVTSTTSDAITPSSIDVKAQSSVGANNVQPLIVGNNILYATARGGRLREMAYSFQAQGYTSGDLTLRAPHLFMGKTIKDLAYSEAPYPVVWAVSSSGKLIGCTYVPEQQIAPLFQYTTGDDTGDKFVSVCVVPEGDEDAHYVAVQRTVNGTSVTCIERFASRALSTDYQDSANYSEPVPTDCVFLDASLTYNGAPATVFTGLGHLEGRTVVALADGCVTPPMVVTSGQVTIDQPASRVTIGLQIDAQLRTLPMVFEGVMAFGQGRPKNVSRAWLRVFRSCAVQAGPSLDRLVEVKQRTTEALGSPPNLRTDEIQIDMLPGVQSGGQVYVRHTNPLPLTITSMTIEADVSG